MKLRSPAEAISLFGQNDQILKVLKNRLNASVVARGDEVKLTGDNEDVKQAALTFQNLLSTIRGGGELSITEIEHADLDNLVAQADEDPHLPKRAQPKTSGQRRYVRAIHRGSITCLLYTSPSPRD